MRADGKGGEGGEHHLPHGGAIAQTGVNAINFDRVFQRVRKEYRETGRVSFLNGANAVLSGLGVVGGIAHSVNSVKNFNKMRGSLSSKDKTALVAHGGPNENIAQKFQQGYLPANYPNPNNAVTRALAHSKPTVWVSEGKPNLFNRIFFCMVGKSGKAQRVIEADVPIPDDVIIKWGGGK